MIEEEEVRPASTRPWLRWVLALLLAFLAGTLGMGYALTHWSGAARILRLPPTALPQTAVAPEPATPARPPMIVTPLPIGEVKVLNERVAELDGRISAIDARARVASLNADRAEALLVAMAARRALDRGVTLGYLEPLLRERFGDSQPQAVATILAAAQEPVTLDELRAGFAAARPALLGAGPQQSWWQGMKREVAGLIVLRRATSVSNQPADRASRAEAALAAGHVERALAEVARLPGRDNAAAWIAAARRYAAARQALDTIEAAALLAPKGESTASADAPPAGAPPQPPEESPPA